MGAMAQGLAGRVAAILCLALLASGCGRINSGIGNIFNGSSSQDAESAASEPERESIFDLFVDTDNPNTTLEVNKYLWNASFDILNFLPIQSADPFTGVIVTGFGTPPGGRTAYRATIFIRDPALEARSLNVALATRSGPVPTETVRAVEDAILTRARQLRLRDLDL